MPVYRVPGVHVEETAFRTRAIEGVATTITAFVGPTASGPLASEAEAPMLVTSALEFDRIFGGLDDLLFGDPSTPNYLARAAHAFFAEGGDRLYVARTPGGAGATPTLADYQAALDRLLQIEAISTVAAPGASALSSGLADGINAALIAHAGAPDAERFAVIDPPPGLDIAGIRAFRADHDTPRTALYYPWILVDDPLAAEDSSRPALIAMPPSGYVCGLYARNDVERAVWKAPANEVLTSAVALQREVTHQEQEVLNPLGVNCIRLFEGRGVRVWGARTLSTDPELKYVNVVRYLSFLSASLNRGLRWTVFEPNTEILWASVRTVVAAFLDDQWREGALQGDRPDRAFFVRCDSSTMSQSDLERGRLICLVGVALIKPAEFVILRIEQTTAETT